MLFSSVFYRAMLKALQHSTNSLRERSKLGRSSKEEHKGNALAPEAEEGRDKLRKAAGNRK